MDKQKLNEAAKEYTIANPMSKRTETFKAGARWHEQQNPWRKVEDELPECKEKICGIYYSKYLNMKVIGLKRPLVGYYVSANDDEFFDFAENVSNITQDMIIEWKYID